MVNFGCLRMLRFENIIGVGLEGPVSTFNSFDDGGAPHKKISVPKPKAPHKARSPDNSTRFYCLVRGLSLHA